MLLNNEADRTSPCNTNNKTLLNNAIKSLRQNDDTADDLADLTQSTSDNYNQ